MINMFKVWIAVFILTLIIAFAVLGKKMLRFFYFDSTYEKPESEVILWVATLLAVAVSIADFTMNKTAPSTLKVIGLWVFFTGAIIQIFTKKVLKEKTFQEAMKKNFHKATSMRIFDKIRHPSKTALLFMVFGLALTLGSIWGILLTIAFFFPALLFRISQEERAFLDEFGDRYYDYQDKTQKIIPFIL